MAHRFFAEQPITGDQYQLQGEQAHHLQNVMRFSVGDQVLIFDGSGREFTAKIVAMSKKAVELSILSATETERTGRTVEIAVALPKGDRQKFLVEKLVELGVHAMIPLETKRGIAVPNAKVVSRIEKQVIEASKQCGRNHLMQIRTPCCTESLASGFEDHIRLLADPYATESMHQIDCQERKPLIVAVGPEGGFTEGELQLLNGAGWQSVRIGNTVLRIETAAMAAATILATRP